MSDHMSIHVTIDDTDIAARLEMGARVPERHDRSVQVEITLPTGEGSEGPDLEGDEWEQALSTLIQRAVRAARLAIDEPDPKVTEELTHLDRVVDAAHQRLDAIGAPDAPPFNPGSVIEKLRQAGEKAATAMREANRGRVDDAER